MPVLQPAGGLSYSANGCDPSAVGTDAWRNWRASLDGEAEIEGWHDELHSDRAFVGGPIDVGPYRLTIISRASRPPVPASVGAAARLRAGLHIDLTVPLTADGELLPVDSTSYHGGTIGDEIAALASLVLGVRLRDAGTVEMSVPSGDDERVPIFMEVPALGRPGSPNVEYIPRALSREPNLDLLQRLNSYPALTDDAQRELARAARAYATGLWWANEDPNQSWLSFVTAVEIAAKHRQPVRVKASSEELVRTLWPDLWDDLQPAPPDVRANVCKRVSQQIKATRKFVDFVVQCAPAPPEARPAFGVLDWFAMEEHATKIYGHRSNALHAGKPFPSPMLEAPRIVDEVGRRQEVPLGITASSLGSSWTSDETPMLLATFEYIVQGALLRWWDELAANSEGRPSPPV